MFLLEHALCELGVYVDMRSLTTTCCPLTKIPAPTPVGLEDGVLD